MAFATAQTSTQHLDVILTSSADNGQAWSTPVRVSGLTNQDDHFQPQLAVAADGSVSWDPARGDTRGFVGERQGLVIGNGSVYLTWNDGRNGPLQIFTAMMPLV